MKSFVLLGIMTGLFFVGINSFAQDAVVPPVDDMQVTPEVIDANAQVEQSQAPVEIVDPFLEGFFEDTGYNPTGRRDPFVPYLSTTIKVGQAQDVPLEPLQKFALSELKLVGIIWDVGKPKALMVDPGGRSHIIIENTKLGQEMGYVAAIREGEIIVVEQLMNAEGRKIFQTKVLKLSSAKVAQ